MGSQFDREIQYLEEALDRGDISLSEFNKEMQELENDYRSAAYESAEMAYREELDRW